MRAAQVVADATGAMPREGVQGEEEAQARMWDGQHSKGMQRKRVCKGEQEGASGKWEETRSPETQRAKAVFPGAPEASRIRCPGRASFGTGKEGLVMEVGGEAGARLREPEDQPQS